MDETKDLFLQEELEEVDESAAEIEAGNSEEAQEPPKATPETVFAKYIYAQTARSKVTAHTGVLLTPPNGLVRKEVEQVLENLSSDEALSNIAQLKGKKDLYYYDETIMTTNYAKTAAMLEDKDILQTVSKTVRFDCKTYPRPTRVLALMDSPYFFSEDEVLGAIARMKDMEEYKDIATVAASNGRICIYSTDYMSQKYARALCEEMEVERYEYQ